MKIDMERYKDKLVKHNYEPRGKTSLAIAMLLASPNLMSIPMTGPISASMINTELGRAAASRLSVNDAEARTLAGVPSGEIKYSDFRGKSFDPFIREDVFDKDTPFTLDPECKRIEFEIVAGGGGGGGAAIYDMGGGGTGDWDGGQGSGGGGAGQYKTGSINVTDRNLYLVIGAGGAGGTQSRPSKGVKATYSGTPGERGGNTDIRVGSASGTVLAWVNGGDGGQSASGGAWGGVSGRGGNDGDGNAGGAGVGVGAINSNTYGNNGNGRAGGSGSNITYSDQGLSSLNIYSSRGGNGGQAGNNGGGRDMAQGENEKGLQSCGGGGGKSAAPWGGSPGKGGAASRRRKNDGTWLYYQATHATGYGNGGGGACKAVYSSYTAIAGNGSNGRVIIRQYRR